MNGAISQMVNSHVSCLLVLTLHKRLPKILIWFSNVLNREEFKIDVPSMIISSSSGIGYGVVVPSLG